MERKNRPDASAFTRRVRRHVAGRAREYYAVTAPGFEVYCRRELAGLGMDPGGMTVDHGGVTFDARFVDCQRANLHLRTATRILMRIDCFMATNWRQLEKKAGDIAWELFLARGALPSVKVSSHRSRLYHTEAIARSIIAGITRRLEGCRSPQSIGCPQCLFVRAVGDRFTLSLDSSGVPLYKRFFKTGAARAPLRETMAAAILMEAGYDPGRPLVDPLCGSGTFSLEAAMLAKQMAPGINRDFAFMGWPAYSENQWAFLRREAESRIRVLDQPRIFASDIDPAACEKLAESIAGNGFSDAVRVARKDFFKCGAEDYADGPGLVVINPPYGIRIGSHRQADDLFNAICRHLVQHFRGWSVALITPNRERVRQVPFAARQLPLFHGGLRLTVIVGAIR